MTSSDFLALANTYLPSIFFFSMTVLTKLGLTLLQLLVEETAYLTNLLSCCYIP